MSTRPTISQYIADTYNAYKLLSAEDQEQYEAQVHAALEEMAGDDMMLCSAYVHFKEVKRDFQSMSNLVSKWHKDIISLTLPCHVGNDKAAQQLSGIITGSDEVLCLLDEHNMDIQAVVTGFMAKIQSSIADQQLAALHGEASAAPTAASSAPPHHPAAAAAASATPTPVAGSHLPPVSAPTSAASSHPAPAAAAPQAPTSSASASVAHRLTATMAPPLSPPPSSAAPSCRDGAAASASTILLARSEKKAQVANKGKAKETDGALGQGLDHHVNFTAMLSRQLAHYSADHGFCLVGWPSLTVPCIPHNKVFIPGKINTHEWKVLDDWATEGTIKLEPWTDEEKALAKGSVEYGNIPLLIDIAGTVLVHINDAPSASIAPPASLVPTAAAPSAASSFTTAAPSSSTMSATAPPSSSAPALPASSEELKPPSHPCPSEGEIADLEAELARLNRRLQSMNSARELLAASFEGYVAGSSPHPSQHPQDSRVGRAFQQAVQARSAAIREEKKPYRGELGNQSHHSAGVPPSMFYNSSTLPPSRCPHASAMPRHVSNPSTSSQPAHQARRLASQPDSTISHVDPRYLPGGLFYQQRYARDGVAGPSHEVYMEEEDQDMEN
ncbi:hypothetical protein CPB84DRAFT_1851445 [Gymnopilus junonius]|uniref:Uncharacterized protein n=1 Tax=Gymnopilus junonius TaxID=109634 RepID=A0A9P5NEP0_GYMJU|nr:hypothetical protein CPB84DRAFT_1851445 [Gymnopilus junonius]